MDWRIRETMKLAFVTGFLDDVPVALQQVPGLENLDLCEMVLGLQNTSGAQNWGSDNTKYATKGKQRSDRIIKC